MDSSTVQRTYYARTRFQRDEEASRRRLHQGGAGRRLTAWAIDSVHRLAGEGSILDLACGNGRHLDSLSKEGNKVYAGDLSDPMLRQAKRLTSHHSVSDFAQMEAENLPFADRSFDAVFCARFFHHLPTADLRGRILREIFRVARNGAVVTIKARFTFEHLKAIAKSFFRGTTVLERRYFISEREIVRAAEKNGWRHVDRYSVHGPFTANRALVLKPGIR